MSPEEAARSSARGAALSRRVRGAGLLASLLNAVVVQCLTAISQSSS
jgi:hypothetical protein